VTATAYSDWRRLIERTMQQQAQELTQLHRTVEHLTNLLQVQATWDEAQRLGMRMSMNDIERKWDAHHNDDKLCEAGITNMMGKVMKGVPPGPETGENERDKTAGMDGGGLEASLHADSTQ